MTKKVEITAANPWTYYVFGAALIMIVPFIYQDVILIYGIMIPLFFTIAALLANVKTKYNIHNGSLYKWDEGLSGKYINGFDGSKKWVVKIKDIKKTEPILHLGKKVGLKIWINEHSQDCINIHTKQSDLLAISIDQEQKSL